MGEIAADSTMTKKKKKKGRPSLLDLQKRSLKEQQLQKRHLKQLPQPNPNPPPPSPVRRSTRRNPNSYAPEWIDGDDDDDEDDDERKQKKHKLLHGLNSQQQQQQQQRNNKLPISSADNSAAASKRRKISAGRLGSDQLGEKAAKATDTLHGSSVEPGPTTPLPDKKLLVFILDRLQKKDTYGVFSEPVDAEELPDYFDIIEDPMDFSTVRKKLDGGVYVNLEQFEKDVFLICSNAMQYNSADTIYFRQARSIQELAKKDFENLRQDSDDGESEPKVVKVVRRGRPPGKLKKSFEKSPLDRVGLEFSSDATLATGGDNSNLYNGYNLRRTTPIKYQPVDSLIRAPNGSHGNETYANWLSEWENEFPASVLRAVLKYGKKPFTIDEHRRDSYKHPLHSMQPSIFSTFEGEAKQLMAVGLSAEHGYARSVARFAADMGSTVWKIASKKIETVLPHGLQFGPGWVGENNVLERQQFLFPNKHKASDNSATDDNLSKLQPSTNTGSNSIATNSAKGKECVQTIGGLICQSESNSLDCGPKSMPSVPIQQKPLVPSDINGSNAGFGYNYSPEMGIARFGTATVKSSLEPPAVPSQMFGMVSTSNNTIGLMSANDFSPRKANLSEMSSGLLHPGNLSGIGSSIDSHKLLSAGLGGKSSWQELPTYLQQDFLSLPPDLNVGFLGPVSPGSSMPIGSPQQPDLALQL